MKKNDGWDVLCVTYNVNTRKPEDDQVRLLLNDDDVRAATIVVFGLQELSHSELFGTIPVESTWLEALVVWMNSCGKSLLCKTSLAWNMLLIFASVEIFPMVKGIDSRQSRSSFGGLTGHKGSVSLRIMFKCNRSLVFITSHLLPHAENYKRRCEQYEYGKVCSFDDEIEKQSVIWLGDLNWRIDSLTASEVVKKIAECNSDCQMNDLVNQLDQLRRAQSNGEAFVDYRERSIQFPPTYRLMVGSSYYDQERVPSWCDRILFKGIGISCERYESNRMVTLSDHLPVRANFNVSGVPGAGAFKWNISFQPVPSWQATIPFTCRFSYTDDFWNTCGSYRDWIGVYRADVPNSMQPITWLYVVACYSSNVSGQNMAVAEFSSLVAGSYRVGYFSIKANCLQGLSDLFKVNLAS